jgi:hypothetical protein
MSHTEYSAQFVQYSSVFLGLEEALKFLRHYIIGNLAVIWRHLTKYLGGVSGLYFSQGNYPRDHTHCHS